jgi:hypothetical protein
MKILVMLRVCSMSSGFTTHWISSGRRRNESWY